jgi:uncharacterized phiE125 gp8 family phage protein
MAAEVAMLIETSGVPEGALPVEEFRAHLRLGTGFGDEAVQDALVGSYLRAAMAAIEGRTGKVLMARGFELVLPDWREAGEQPLPVAPVVSVEAVTLVDRAGSPTVLPPERWRLVRDTHRPRIVGAGGWLLPAVPAGGQVTVAFTAGFGPAWQDVPVDLRQAVFLLAAHYHEQRHQLEQGQSAMPFGVMALVERWRTLRLLGGAAR